MATTEIPAHENNSILAGFVRWNVRLLLFGDLLAFRGSLGLELCMIGFSLTGFSVFLARESIANAYFFTRMKGIKREDPYEWALSINVQRRFDITLYRSCYQSRNRWQGRSIAYKVAGCGFCNCK